jgi:hypothetical protein
MGDCGKSERFQLNDVDCAAAEFREEFRRVDFEQPWEDK